MKHIPTIITSALLLLSSQVFSQQSNDLPYFELLSTSQVIDGENYAIYTTLTKSGNVLVWHQKSGGNSLTTEFDITSGTVSWDTTSSTGSIDYDLTTEGIQGSFSLQGNGNGTKAFLTILVPDVGEQTFEFTIKNIDYQ